MSHPQDSSVEHEQEEHVLRPSPWPFAAAGGLSLILFGMTSSYAFSALGVLFFLWGIAGWIGDMLRG